jgi:phosphoglycerate kinase
MVNMQVRSIREAQVSGKRALVRVDFNVPIKDGKVVDDLRIRAAVPTLEFLQHAGASKIVLLTHVGRPEGKVVEGLRVAPVEARLRELTAVPFELRENLRFDPREEKNDEGFARELAALGDVYVNDAFAVSHRASASLVAITKFLPSYAGLLVEEEINRLSKALTPPAGAVAVIGGAKFETKQPLIAKLLSRYSALLLGGALGNDVIKARGMPFGASLISSVPVPINIASDEKLFVASDVILRRKESGETREALVNDIRSLEAIVDIGPRTAGQWAAMLAQAPFVLWNGPMGVYEEGFTAGTEALAGALATSGAEAVVGGGDTAAAIAKFSFDTEKVFISTGGGAMLEFLTAGTLPALEPLKK